MRLIISTLLALGLAACDSSDESSCTLIGCASNGLVITLTDTSGGPAPSGHYRVTAVSTEVVTPQQCDFDLPRTSAAPACLVGDASVSFDGYAPNTLTVLIAHDGAPAYSGEEHVTYTTSRPNGEGCDPVCKVGTLSLPIP